MNESLRKSYVHAILYHNRSSPTASGPFSWNNKFILSWNCAAWVHVEISVILCKLVKEMDRIKTS